MKRRDLNVYKISLILGISLFSHAIHSGATVYLYNNYGKTLNYVISSQQPEAYNIANNTPVSLGDVNYIAQLKVYDVGYTYSSELNLMPYLIDIKNKQAQHPNEDAMIIIDRSTWYSPWNVRDIQWEPKGKIKSFELAEFPAMVGAPKVQPTPSQPLTQPAVTMDIRELEVIIADTADQRLTLIKNGNLGPDYARKAAEICNANYTQAEKLGKINLCSRLKTELLAPKYDIGIESDTIKNQIAYARKRGQRVVVIRPDLAPAIDDIKSSINRMHNALAGYKNRGEAQ